MEHRQINSNQTDRKEINRKVNHYPNRNEDSKASKARALNRRSCNDRERSDRMSVATKVLAQARRYRVKGRANDAPPVAMAKRGMDSART